MSLPRVLVPDRGLSAGSRVFPDRRTIHHLHRVLRLATGDHVVLVDGDGSAFVARIVHWEGTPGLEIVREAPDDRAVGQTVRLVLIVALLKSDLTELAVRKVTEAGVASVLVAVCDRSIPRPDREGLAARETRFRRVAAAAARQSGRGTIPEITVFPCLDSAVKSVTRDLPRFVLSEEPGARLLADHLKNRDRSGAVMATGPEGSFTDREISMLEKAGFRKAGLGPRVLRAETAAIASVVVAQTMMGDMGTT